MKIYKAFATVLIALSFIVINGCSKNNSNPESPQSAKSNTPPTLPTVNFSAPQSGTSDPVMSLIKGYVQSINAIETYSKIVKGLEAQRQNDNWFWSFVKDSLTITITATQLSDGNFQWNVFLSGMKDNISYNNWLSAQGISSPDGKNGTWKIFKDNTTLLEGEYTWDRASDGTITGVAKALKNGTETGRIELLNHPDKSGQVVVYVMNNLFFKALWQPDGSGEWWRYGLNGAVISKGTWT